MRSFIKNTATVYNNQSTTLNANSPHRCIKVMRLSPLAGAWLLASCASQQAPLPTAIPQPQPAPVVQIEETSVIRPAPAPTPIPLPMPRPTATEQYASFGAWKQDFIRRGTQQGYSLMALEQLLMNARVNEQVVSLDRGQAEFAKMPWEYVDSAASSARIRDGARSYANEQRLLADIESRYGVPSEIVTAIWGMESSYGAATGRSDLPAALATLAYDGRRREFAESQLLALLQMQQRGDIFSTQVQGSWAGGMGHTQFIPTTWISYGVDGDGDGRRNPWDRADALNATANYLASSGWVRGVAPFYEVRLPAGFDYGNVGSMRSYADWQRLGISLLGDGYVDALTPLTLWLPAGKDGPALLTSRNFEVIKVYNNSSNYALGVSLLARGIRGQSGIIQSWPRHESPLSRWQVLQLQERLTAMGFDTKGADGVIGTNTRLAFASWQAANGFVPDGFISQRSAASLLR